MLCKYCQQQSVTPYEDHCRECYGVIETLVIGSNKFMDKYCQWLMDHELEDNQENEDRFINSKSDIYNFTN